MADSITRCDWGAQGKPAPDWIGGHGPRSEPIGNEAMAKILLIEDDCETAEEITAELEQRGYETEWGASGIEGLDKARSCRPDAMIVDRMLPGMDGLTIIEALRQEQVRTMLSESLKGVVSQVLCKKIGGGRVAAREILLVTPAVSNLIREGKILISGTVQQLLQNAEARKTYFGEDFRL